MAEKQKRLMEEDAYASGKYSKVADFFIGLGIVVGIGIIIQILISGIIFLLAESHLSLISTTFPSLLYLIGLIIFVGAPILIYRNYFLGRKLIKIGLIIGLLLPFLAILIFLGACFIIFSQSGW